MRPDPFAPLTDALADMLLATARSRQGRLAADLHAQAMTLSAAEQAQVAAALLNGLGASLLRSLLAALTPARREELRGAVSAEMARRGIVS